MARLSFTTVEKQFLAEGLILVKSGKTFEIKQDNGKSGRSRRINTLATLDSLQSAIDWLLDYHPATEEDPTPEDLPQMEEISGQIVEYIYTTATEDYDIDEFLTGTQDLPLINADNERWREIQTTNFNAQFDRYMGAGFDVFNRESWEGEPDQLGLKFLQVRSAITSAEGLAFIEKASSSYYKPSTILGNAETEQIIALLRSAPEGLPITDLSNTIPKDWGVLELTRRLSQSGYGSDISEGKKGLTIKLVLPHAS